MATAPKAAPKVVSIDDGGATSAPSKSSKKPALFALLLLLALGAGGAGAWYFLESQPPSEPATVPPPVPQPVYLQVDQFVVNLQSEFGEQYLQIAMTLQVADQPTFEQIRLYMPLVRSRLLMLLSSKKAADINTPAGKQTLQEEILAILRAPLAMGLPETRINGVFFTSFVIQ